MVVLFPFHIPIYVPRPLSNAILDTLRALRVISRKHNRSQYDYNDDQNGKVKPFVRLNFPMTYVTAPLIADLFLLAISAIGRQEVYGGTIGADHISPIDIMAFFITLAYIAISIDASGLIKYLAFKVLQKGGGVGHRLFFYLYAFFFGLGIFIGNGPIVLSGTPFLAYMTRASSNIIHPRAWIHTQFAVANIASAILVSSNPTNLMLAGAFEIKFVKYTANMIVPVVVTGIVLFPFLLYIIFADESLIPFSIKMHELPEEERAKKPVNPNIPNARGIAEEEENELANGKSGKRLPLQEIMNPFIDKGGAWFGALIMATTIITLLTLNALSQSKGEHPAYWVTLPAAFVLFCWDVGFGWTHRHETREIARKGRQEVEQARAERAIREEEVRRAALEEEEGDVGTADKPGLEHSLEAQPQSQSSASSSGSTRLPDLSSLPHPTPAVLVSENDDGWTPLSTPPLEGSISMLVLSDKQLQKGESTSAISIIYEKQEMTPADSSYLPKGGGEDEEKRVFSKRISPEIALQQEGGRRTLISLLADTHRWLRETFPTAMAVLANLPFALVPFALSLFVLVQALVTKGWVQVFAYGWDHWVNKTGTVGAIGGMGFISVVLCNVSCFFRVPAIIAIGCDRLTCITRG
jgi:Na+/H+ antiporter NhaD/arsenite permease-like protein